MNKLRELLKTYREPILYLVFGVLTTAVSFLSAGLAKWVLETAGVGVDAMATVSTVFSWVCAVTFAYLTNRRFVFRSQVKGASAVLKEAAAFYGGRVSTLLFETVFMWVGSRLLGEGAYWWVKIAANVIILILNYVISKVFVFKKK